MKKKGFLIAGIVCAVACVGCILWAVLPAVIPGEKPHIVTPASSATVLPSAEPSAPAYVSPVDFDQLQQRNPEAYAWLSLPGTDISYPVLQREGDDAYYLTHTIDHELATHAALYTEATYNTRTFHDPATVIYGHNMRNGSMFGSLRSMYALGDGLTEHNEAVIFLPDRELHYRLFAAVEIHDAHLLHTYNFADPAVYSAFMDEIFSLQNGPGRVVEADRPQPGDRLLIMETCLSSNRIKRFVLIGKLLTD